jgi:hypothetical protein
MGDEVVGVRMKDNRGRGRGRIVHTNVAFWLAREMPVGHERGRKLRWKERGRRTHQSGVVGIYI